MHRSRRLWALGACASLLINMPVALGRGEDVTHTGPSFTKPDFLMHAPNSDLTAHRMDCDVFGWSKDFTEVGAVGSDVHRGSKGKHRGDVYMLIYKVGQPLPIHNVNVHYVTHADLPNNPIPLDDARDLIWAIEGDYLKMWPRRPKYERPKKAMRVEMLWSNVPADGDLCTPHVGFLLHYKKATHFVNFVPMDMSAACSDIKQSDKRIYWGKDDLAVAMVRFDYSPTEQEKSVRFVVNADWKAGTDAHISLADGSGGTAPTLETTRALLKQFGAVKSTSSYPEEKSNARTYGVYAIAARPAFAGLARYLARALKLPQCRFETLPETGGPDVAVRIGVIDRQMAATSSEQVVQVSDPADPRALERRHSHSDFSTVDDAVRDINHPAARVPEPSAMPSNLPTEAPTEEKAPPPRYLDGWQVH